MRDSAGKEEEEQAVKTRWAWAKQEEQLKIGELTKRRGDLQIHYETSANLTLGEYRSTSKNKELKFLRRTNWESRGWIALQ